ncbi:MAG TPA: serine hydrolase [Chitinophagaceae bacterium]
MVMTPSQEFKKGVAAYSHTDNSFRDLLNHYSPHLLPVLDDPERYVQVIYSRIDRDKLNRPRFSHYYYNVRPDHYFYPASTVKMPAAVLALQKLNELNIPGLDRNTTMIHEAAFSGQTPVYNDPTSPDGRPTIAHYIKKIFLVSDNDAFNRLYEFLGQEYINKELHKKGYDSAQVIHRLDIALSEEQNRATNPVAFYDTTSQVVYRQPPKNSELEYHRRHTLLGKGYIKEGQLVEQPFDFSQKNRLTLADLHSIQMSVLFPGSVSKEQRFHLTEEDYRFLYRTMSTLPRESGIPQYENTYDDAYVKFLMFGGSGPMEDSSIRIFNKVGDAYGFLTETAYIVDFDKGVEFLLSATIYCNSDGIFNDDQYEYKTVGFPFLKELGRAIYTYERQRDRRHMPDLSAFRFLYKEE